MGSFKFETFSLQENGSFSKNSWYFLARLKLKPLSELRLFSTWERNQQLCEGWGHQLGRWIASNSSSLQVFGLMLVQLLGVQHKWMINLMIFAWDAQPETTSVLHFFPLGLALLSLETSQGRCSISEAQGTQHGRHLRGFRKTCALSIQIIWKKQVLNLCLIKQIRFLSDLLVSPIFLKVSLRAVQCGRSPFQLRGIWVAAWTAGIQYRANLASTVRSVSIQVGPPKWELEYYLYLFSVWKSLGFSTDSIETFISFHTPNLRNDSWIPRVFRIGAQKLDRCVDLRFLAFLVQGPDRPTGKIVATKLWPGVMHKHMKKNVHIHCTLHIAPCTMWYIFCVFPLYR